MITAETRRQFIKNVAHAFFDKPFIEERDGDLIGLAWEGDGLNAGVGINAEACWVFMAGATAPADSAEEAIDLLHTIFADEIVAVAAYEDGVLISHALANASDLHRPPHLLVPIDPRTISRVNEIHVRSWSGKLDEIRPWSGNQ